MLPVGDQEVWRTQNMGRLPEGAKVLTSPDGAVRCIEQEGALMVQTEPGQAREARVIPCAVVDGRTINVRVLPFEMEPDSGG